MNPRTYATDIVKGVIPAGQYVYDAAERFLNDLEREDLYFDDKEYGRLVRFFNRVLWDGQTWNDQPIKLEPPQEFILANIFGLKRKENGLRKHKSIYIQVGRKNTKTTTIAGIALWELLASGEDDPHIPVGANNENQSKICTTQAAKMVRAADLESEGVRIYEYRGNAQKIVYNGGSIEAMSKEAKTKDGLLISMAVVDEYHEAVDGRLLNVFESGMGNRLQPLSIVITTAGYNKSGPCYQTLRKSSIDILRGITEDDSHFSFICEPDPEDDPGDRETWHNANPMMDYISTIEPYLKDRYKKATNEGGETMVEFKTKNLNMWADSSEAPIQDNEWVKNTKCTIEGNPAAYPVEYLNGKTAWLGIDLGDTGDMTAAVFLTEDNEILPLFWIPSRQLDHKNNAILYKKWLNQGFLRVAGEEVADYRQIASEIGEMALNFDLRLTGYDKYRMSHGTIQELLDDGMTMGEISMSYSVLTDPTEEFIKLALEGKFEHFNNPILRWMVSNLEIERKGTYKMPSKGKSQNKIDGVAALIIALATRNATPEATEVKIYGI